MKRSALLVLGNARSAHISVECNRKYPGWRFMSVFGVAVSAILIVTFSLRANCQQVFLKTDTQQGEGLLRSRGEECFVVTAGHVVKDPGNITVVDSEQRESPATLVKLYSGNDIGIIRLDKNALCSLAKWRSPSSQAASSGLSTNVNGQGKMVRIRESGTTEQMQIFVKAYDNQYVTIVPASATEKLTEGWSGSPLYVNATLVGMMVTVEGNKGELYRIDYINQLIEPFFTTDEPGCRSTEAVVTEL